MLVHSADVLISLIDQHLKCAVSYTNGLHKQPYNLCSAEGGRHILQALKYSN